MDTQMMFVEANISEEKVFDGLVLPKTLMPVNESRSSVNDLMMGIKMSKEWISETIRRHGAILFRGFNVDGGEDFRHVTEAFGWDDMAYVGASVQVKICERVFTANEAPLDFFIGFHHEMARMKTFPSKVFFYCDVPSPDGGQTSLARSYVLLREMEKEYPDFLEKLERFGLVLDMVYAKDNTNQLLWGKSSGDYDLAEMEKRAKETILACSGVEIMEDECVKFVVGPLKSIKMMQGDKLLFDFGNISKDRNLRLGDGTPVPQQVLDRFTKILDEISVDVKWQKGDVLLVDNQSTQHARRPGKPPRRVFVSVCK